MRLGGQVRHLSLARAVGARCARSNCSVKGMRDYFRRPAGFFANHLKRYSKSPRQASGTFSACPNGRRHSKPAGRNSKQATTTGRTSPIPSGPIASEKCKSDRSLVIAHGLEDICEVKPPEKRQRRRERRRWWQRIFGNCRWVEKIHDRRSNPSCSRPRWGRQDDDAGP